MSLLDRIDRFRRVWNMLVPQFACPNDAQIYRWAGRFDDDALEHGLQRVRAKVTKGGITSQDGAARYLTGVLLNEQRVKTVSCAD
jgi:hypothetical protein